MIAEKPSVLNKILNSLKIKLKKSFWKKAIMIRFSLLIFLSFSLLGVPVAPAFSTNVRDVEELKNEERKIVNSLEEAEEYLESLQRKRKILEGDFYGVNLTAYRYVNIFDRLGYIRYRIVQIDKKIKDTKLEISELRKKLRK